MTKKVTIKNGKNFHRDINIEYASQIIGDYKWRLEKAKVEHRKLHGWTIRGEDDGPTRPHPSD